VGGVSTENIAERYDFTALTWTRLSDDVGFYFSRGPSLVDGDTFLALGGNQGKAASAGYPDDPTTSPVSGTAHAFSEKDGWTSFSGMLPRRHAAGVLGPDGQAYYVIGGHDDTADLARMQVYSK